MTLQQLVFKTIGIGLNAIGIFSPKTAALIAYKLFVTPPRPIIRPKDLDFLATANRKDVLRDGREVVEYHWGEANAPYILLSYGWAYNSGRWRYFVPQLVAAGYRVIAYDPPGHGLAPKGELHLVYNVRILQAIITTYGAPTLMMGHSFGGAASVAAVALLPKEYHPQRMAVLASFSDGMHVFRQFQRGAGLLEKVFQAYVDCIKSHAPEFGGSMDIARLTPALGHIKTLLVHDPLDKVTAGNQSQRYHLYWPASVLYAPLGATHHLGTPRVTDAILDFLIKRKIPQTATVQEHSLPAEVELKAYFARA